ncbi:MAG: hypothetical protein IK092_01455 [Muribaculaceae bacterium]|nr:hypothetical protein [Muribaculaceae bacterium]
MALAIMLPLRLGSQSLLPSDDGATKRFNAMIEMPKAYVSGVCVLLRQGDTILGSLFNEFGITALEFECNTVKKKVKLITLLPMLDKWYIRRTLKNDLKQLVKVLDTGDTIYTNTKRKIEYRFVPQNDSITQTLPL